MTALVLRQVLADAGVEIKALADHCGLSRSTASYLINHGRWPKRQDAAALRASITEFLRARGLCADGRVFKEAPSRGNATAPSVPPQSDQQKDTDMVLRKQTLTQAARRAFGVQRDPFQDPEDVDDVFLSGDIRYVRESILSVIRFGGFLAVVGQSGAGKSTLLDELDEFVTRTMPNVHLVRPYTIGSEDNDARGKTLKAQHVVEALMARVAPLTPMKSSPQARFHQLHHVLRESAKNGNRHVLVIEEGHSLSTPMFKHLRRFRDQLKDGMKHLLSIVLIAQPELYARLSEMNPEVREVVQRLEFVNLAPLDTELDAFVAYRFKRAGLDMAKVMEPSALDAVRSALSVAGKNSTSLLYPQAVQNLLASAMNQAAELGVPRVTADLVRSV